MRPRLLLFHGGSVSPGIYTPLRDVADVTLAAPDQELLERDLGLYDALLIELGLRLDAALIARSPRLRIVATSTTGTDHLDVKAIASRGIELISLKTDFEILRQVSSTAELAWGLLLSVVRRLPWAFDAVKRGEWPREQFLGRQLRGKTLGILGFGRLGRIIADMGLGFHMKVAAHDLLDFEPPPGVRKVDLPTLLAESDVLTIHIHLTDENYHFLDADRIGRMRSGAVLINTSRGAVVDERALIGALASGRLGGAGVDVLEDEIHGGIGRHPLVEYARGHENVVISPHIGGTSREAIEMCLAHTVLKLRAALAALGQGEPPR